MLTLIVTWRNRVELKQALPSFIETIELLKGELIIINFGGEEEYLIELIDRYVENLSVVKVENQKYFHKTLAANIGASYSTKELLFFCDCDIILNPNDIKELCEKVRNNKNTFGNLIGVTETEVNSIGYNHIKNFGYELKIKTADNRELKIIDQEEDADNGYRNAPGLLVVKKSDFIKINGYNGELQGWGWEDQDMVSRLTLGAGLQRIFYGVAKHISHNDNARTGNYPEKDRWVSRDSMFRQALSNYDKNHFQGTYEEDLKSIQSNIVKLNIISK